MPSLDYLEEERKKLWNEIVDIKSALKKKTSDHERDAKQSSKMASEYRNRCETSKETILRNLSSADTALSGIRKNNSEVTSILSTVRETGILAKTASEDIDLLNSKISVLDAFFEERENLEEKLSLLSDITTKGEESYSKISALYSALQKRKNEFDELYFEVLGYEDTDEETGEPHRVEGLKDELDKSYQEIKREIVSLKSEVKDINESTLANYEAILEEQEQKFGSTIDEWTIEYTNLSGKVDALLPNALTAGLSHAFSEKRKSEIKEGEKLRKQFLLSIIGLVAVSLIPFAINVYLLNTGKSLESVIFDMPRLVVAIFPLYIPVLWLAYSSSKKINLSKRLVEEYTHKEVLSKTFEGLSSQISGIEDSDMSAELKAKLLFNILDVSSENPGKLISDYNKADHPLMDALDKSAKLSDAVDSLSKIPGFGKMAKILEEKANRLLRDQTEKVESSLGSVIKNPDKTKSVSED